MLLGLTPWFWFHALSTRGDPALSVYGSGLSDLVSLANIPYRIENFAAPFWHSAYLPALGRDHPLPGALALALMALCALVAAVFAARAAAGRVATPLALAFPALALAFVGLYLLVKPPGVAGEVLQLHQTADQMRYLVPLVPLSGLCAAVALPRLGRVGWALLLAFLALGFTARLTGLDVAHLSARPLFLPGAEPGHAVGRSGHIQVEERADAPAWLAALHPLVRRPFLVGAGNRLTEGALAGSGWERLAAFAAQLDDPERRVVLAATAETLLRRRDALSPDARSRIEADLLALPEEARCPLFQERLRLAPPEALRDPAALHAAALRDDPAADPCAHRAVAWLAGRAALEAAARDLSDPGPAMAQVRATSALLPAGGRAAFLSGAGEAAGEAWGYSGRAWAAQREALPESARLAFDEGFARGARWTFHWPAAVP
jgi:hypothetical protein